MKLVIPIEPMGNSLPTRFRSKIEFTESCWLWKTGKFKNGYGQYWADGRGVSAHRYSWMHYNGPIPSGLAVLHKCDTPGCVNPNHLFLGTNAENSVDMATKGRAAKGEGNGNSKLTWKEVDEIRKLYKPGTRFTKSEFSVAGLAKKYGVSTSTIHSILKNQIWTTSIGETS